MSDNDGKKTLGVRGGGPRAGNVKQSFSHGRTKNVVVETKRKRVVVPKPGAAKSGGSGNPALGDPKKRPAGISDAEMQRRLKALQAAKARETEEIAKREAEEKAREEERARRRAEAEAKEREEREREEALKAKAEEEARKKKEAEEAAKRAAAQAAAAASAPAEDKAAPRKAKEAPAAAPRGGRKDNRDNDQNRSRKGRDDGRRSGKLTLNQALSGGEGGRQKSLAAMKRKQERLRQKAMGQQEREKIVRDVQVPETIVVSELANRMAERVADVVKELMKMGMMVTQNQSIDADTAELIVEEFGHKVVRVSDSDVEDVIDTVEDKEADLKPRPPVITIMGHVDHGKTSLLDAIRNANVTAGEAGGITQHIGAYQVSVEHDGAERPITFIDTPGHEAFTAMRARGAKATDIAILVVAADDGVMPQTIEAVNHAQAAEVPIVVAVNKIDKEGADPSKIRGQLTEYGLIPEEYGGDTMFVDISAKNNVNIEQLLESVLLTADASLDLRANPDMEAQGVAIEAHLDRGRGPVATVLVQRGTLRVGDSIVAGDAYGRVRRMVDEHGEDVEEALPSRPVQVIGFTSVPGAGDNLLVVDEDRIARQIADRRNARKRNALAARARKRISLEDLDSALKETSQLNLILKGDNAGTVEALEEALLGIQVDDEVELRVIDRGVGGVTETNVNLASASDAIIIGFNVRAEGKATELANREGVEIRYYSVIYQAIDEIESALKGMLKPIYEERELGRAEIRAIFRSSKVGNIAGCLVQSGIMRRNAKARLLRDNVVVAENLTVSSLKREKDDATEVREGYECGLTLTYSDIKEGDVIETYELVEKERV